jgi:L-rhamnose-H+ transport protein
MVEHFGLGMAVVFLAGILNGSFTLPMKYSRQWRWENTWLVFALGSLIILPWVLAVGFVPQLAQVYEGVDRRALLYPLIFGFLWGIAQTTFGLAIRAVGMALAFAIVSGLVCLTGSLVPLLVFNSTDLFHPQGAMLLISMPVLFFGLGFYAKAGRRREEEQASPQSGAAEARGSFKAGLAICIFTGVLGSNWNLGFAFSGNMLRRSLELGATPITATYAVWALVLSAGFIPNFLYCVFLLFRRRTWPLFSQENWLRETSLAVAMALLWVTGIVGYGIGATLVGKYGTSVGFTLYIAATMLSSSALGMLTGEWKATSRGTKKLLAAGIASILVSVLVLNLGGLFSGSR